MLRTVAVVLVACAVTLPLVSAKPVDALGDGDVERAEKEFAASAARAAAVFDDALAKAAEQTIKVVDAEMKAATTRGDLEAALRLRDKKRHYLAIASHANLVLPVVGMYAAKSTKWGNQDLLLRNDKTFGRPAMGRDHESEGKWELESQLLTLKWNDWPPKELQGVAAFTTSDLTLTWKSEITDK